MRKPFANTQPFDGLSPAAPHWCDASLVVQAAALVTKSHSPEPDTDRWSTLSAGLAVLPMQSRLDLPAKMKQRQIRVRGVKDSLLKNIIVTLCDGASETILNPCCVFARHSLDLARRLPSIQVVASDIDSRWQRMYRLLDRARLRREPSNFCFQVQSVYEPHAPGSPLAVCFFGACGSMTDAAFRLAIGSGATYIIGRACCHENIGMNTVMSTRAATLWNLGHRVKNRIYRSQYQRLGRYGHPSAGIETYPLSRTVRQVMTSEDMLRCAQHAVDCGLCRAMIDLDRALFLEDNSYAVLGCDQSMFIAVRSDRV